jgi:hypothetical protein
MMDEAHAAVELRVTGEALLHAGQADEDHPAPAPVEVAFEQVEREVPREHSQALTVEGRTEGHEILVDGSEASTPV